MYLVISNDGIVYMISEALAALQPFKILVGLYVNGSTSVWGFKATILDVSSQRLQDIVLLECHFQIIGITSITSTTRVITTPPHTKSPSKDNNDFVEFLREMFDEVMDDSGTFFGDMKELSQNTIECLEDML